ncbi:transcriptional regulator [Roseibacillus persicicus]|uniref:Transcriptional regulator n=1 Tax=Roseibacillus persicicus TaxID=454148 RepID=A0A918WL63_9BACT|nr:transcriptional regulator [Roseibacillus persicicus]
MKTNSVSQSSSDSQILKQGDLLIADPSLRDGIFRKAVILLAQHSAEGAFGLILNQPAGSKVGDFLKDQSFQSLARIPVHVGGPVAREHLTFAAFWKSPENELRYAIRISAQDAISHSKNPGTLVRAFVGYSGWSGGQLEGELERSSWVVSPPPESLLGMTHDQSLWEDTLNGLSPFHRLLALCPEHPWMN